MDVEVSSLKSQTENLRKSLQNSNVATSWGVFRVRIKKKKKQLTTIAYSEFFRSMKLLMQHVGAWKKNSMTDNSVTKCVLIYTMLFINFNRTIYHSKNI